MEGGDTALYAPGFFRIEILIRLRKEFFDSLAITTVNRNADAGGELGLLLVFGHDYTDAIRDVLRFFVLRLRQNESELITAITGGGVDGATMNAQDGRETAKGAAANEMAKAIVNFFQAVEIEEQDGE